MALAVASKAADSPYSATQSPDSTYPSTVNANDIIICVFIGSSDADANGTPPTGWTRLYNDSVGTGLYMGVFWKRADGSETGTLTWTTIFAASESGTSVMFTVSGAITTGTPVETCLVSTTTTGTAKDSTAKTPTASDTLAVGLFAHSSARTFVWDSPQVEEYDSNTTPDGGNNPGLFACSLQLSGTPSTSVGGDASSNCATVEGCLFFAPAAAAEQIPYLVAASR